MEEASVIIESCELSDNVESGEMVEVIDNQENIVFEVVENPESQEDQSLFTDGEQAVLVQSVHSNEFSFSQVLSDSVVCNLCNKSFTNEATLKRHRRRVHPEVLEEGAPRVRSMFEHACLEDSCKQTFTNKMDLVIHLEEKHGIPMEHVGLSFDSAPRFFAWLEEFQESTSTRFCKATGGKNNVSGCLTYMYICHRSGKPRIKPVRQRKERTVGTKKLGIQCTAHLKVKETLNGHVEVRGCCTHYGHEVDPKFLTLLAHHRSRVASLLNTGQPFTKLVQILKHSPQSGSNLWLSYLTVTEVRNIQQMLDKSFSNAAKIIFEKIGGLLNSDPLMVLVHKPIGADVDGMRSEDFYAVLQKECQVAQLKEYINSIWAVCCDVVYHMEFTIVTLQVAAKKDDGKLLIFPLAWFVTSCKDAHVFIQTMYYAVVEQTGRFDCDVFFSDDHDEYFVNFLHVFGLDNVPKKLVNLWQIQNYLEVECISRVPEISKVLNVFEHLTTVFRQDCNVEEFSQALGALQESLASDSAYDLFRDLFEAQYVSRTLLWAPCYMGVDVAKLYTEFEKEHHIMQYFCDFMVFNRCPSRLIEVLVNYSPAVNFEENDLTEENQTCSAIQGIIPESSAQSETVEEPLENQEEAASRALEPPLTETFDLIKVSDSIFRLSNASEQFTVFKMGCTIKNCQEKCGHCDTCIHEYNCSCQDEPQVCKHIHVLISFENRKKLFKEQYRDQYAVLSVIKEYVAKLDEVANTDANSKSVRDFGKYFELMKDVIQDMPELPRVVNCHSEVVVDPETGIQMEKVTRATNVAKPLKPTVITKMLKNPQIIVISSKSKLHVEMPSDTKIDAIPADMVDTWKLDVALNAKPLLTNIDKWIRILLSNGSSKSIHLLLTRTSPPELKSDSGKELSGASQLDGKTNTAQSLEKTLETSECSEQLGEVDDRLPEITETVSEYEENEVRPPLKKVKMTHSKTTRSSNSIANVQLKKVANDVIN